MKVATTKEIISIPFKDLKKGSVFKTGAYLGFYMKIKSQYYAESQYSDVSYGHAVSLDDASILELPDTDLCIPYPDAELWPGNPKSSK